MKGFNVLPLPRFKSLIKIAKMLQVARINGFFSYELEKILPTIIAIIKIAQ